MRLRIALYFLFFMGLIGWPIVYMVYLIEKLFGVDK